MLADDSLDELALMDGWSVDGEIARFQPFDPGWSARVDYRVVYGKHNKKWSTGSTTRTGT